MKKVVILTTVCIVVFLAFFNLRPNSSEPSKIRVKDKDVIVQIVRSDQEITKGLGYTTSLGENQGMLFDFPIKNQMHTFWMKDMLIPIDIIWIDDSKIVQIDKDVQIPIDPTQPESTLVPSTQPVDYVLEVNAGWTQQNNISVGDSVDLKNIN